jgi:hypothetical protein
MVARKRPGPSETSPPMALFAARSSLGPRHVPWQLITLGYISRLEHERGSYLTARRSPALGSGSPFRPHRRRCTLSRSVGERSGTHVLASIPVIRRYGHRAAHAAAAWSPCPDPGAVCTVQCYDAYCSIWRVCWVTETGIGVCNPVRYGHPPRGRQANEGRR